MITRSFSHICRRYSQFLTFKTTETSPIQHSDNHLGLFYTLNPETCKQLFANGGLPRSFVKQCKTFTETSFMIRQPALELINCIKSSNLSQPAIRYVIYGEKGSGKSLTLAHLIHFAHVENFLIVHIPWVSEWLRRITKYKEISNSPTREGFVDITLNAAAWLLHFKNQNQNLFKSLNLKTSNEYVWSKRETTPVGASLVELVDLGINRVKYSCDVVDALITEIKTLSDTNQCKTFVAIDGFNCFFYPLTRLSTPTKRKVPPEDVSLTSSFMRITQNDWTNGVIVLTADELAVPEDHHESFLPKYLLYKKGFEHLDPFVPIKVDRYTEKEFMSCTSYYRDRLWLRGPPEIDTELKMTSACNPYKFMELCAPL